MATACVLLYACFSSAGSLALSLIAEMNQDNWISFVRTLIKFLAAIVNLASYKIIMNLLMRTNNPKIEKHDDVFKMHLSLRFT